MILIIGSTHDDILYFENVLTNRKEEVIFNRFTCYRGNLFNQEVLVVGEMYSSILTSAVLTHLLEHNYVDLVINVGRCLGVDRRSKNGDIVISEKIIDANVDFSSISDVQYGQIPGFQREFSVQNDIIGYLKVGLKRRTYVSSYNALYLSSDNLGEDTLNFLSEHRNLFGVTDERIVIDHNSIGVALAALLKDVPFVSIKIVENKIDRKGNIDTYLMVLEKYIDLGKAVVATIGDIGRNDILRGGVGNEYKNRL